MNKPIYQTMKVVFAEPIRALNEMFSEHDFHCLIYRFVHCLHSVLFNHKLRFSLHCSKVGATVENSSPFVWR